jgi:hypothetical protein
MSGFTTVDLGCERGNNAYNIVQWMDEPQATQMYMRTFDELWNDPVKLQDVTDAVIENISTVYAEHAPEMIYLTTLYHILFVLVWEDRMRLAVAYKETPDAKSTGVRVERYYYTDWMPVGEAIPRLEGLSMDAVYENLVRRIAGSALGDAPTSTLRESVAEQGRRERIEKQIAALEAKIRREKQPKKKFELVTQLRALQNMIEL